MGSTRMSGVLFLTALRESTNPLGRDFPAGLLGMPVEETRHDDVLRRSAKAEHTAWLRAIVPCRFTLAQSGEIGSAHGAFGT